MAGIDKITDQILNKAETEKESILLRAREEADSIAESTQEEIEKFREETEGKTAAKLKDMEDRLQSAIAQQSKLMQLTTRQEIISGLLNDAKMSIKNASGEVYFTSLLKLLSANVQKNDGEIRFSAEDLKRLPADLEKKIEAIAKEKGGSLKLSKQPADIQDGFLLVYGLIEENCSLDAVFAAAKDDLTDLVNSML